MPAYTARQAEGFQDSRGLSRNSVTMAPVVRQEKHFHWNWELKNDDKKLYGTGIKTSSSSTCRDHRLLS